MAKDDKVELTEAEWRERLTPEQFRVLRGHGTERAFTGKYWDAKTAGTYRCAGCGETLYVSDTKYDSGCGWPSFYAAASEGAIETSHDTSIPYMPRTEVHCAKCGGHLGHIFDDGPAPTGIRHCINSASLEFEPKK